MDLDPNFRLDVGIDCRVCNLSSQDTCPGNGTLETIYLSAVPVLSWSCVGLGLLGIIGNSLTLLVYAKLGFHDNINTSYATLALSDLLCSLSTVVCGICRTPVVKDILERYQIQTDMAKIADVFGLMPHLAFSRTTALLTSWISVERFLCVAFPTRAKTMVTRRASRAALTALFIAGCAPTVLTYASCDFDWKVNPQDNSTILIVNRNIESLGSKITMVVYGMIYPSVSWITVALCTAFLIHRLRRNARWRNVNASTAQNSGTILRRMSVRENRLTRVVVAITCAFIICTLIAHAHALCLLILPGYSPEGTHLCLYMMAILTLLNLNQVNSSVNIVVFTILGSRFRYALVKMFRWKE